MVKKILHASDPKLRKASKKVKKVDKKTLNIARDLVDTLIKQKDPEGVGLAAPQIGIRTRMFAIEEKGGYKVIINPNTEKKVLLSTFVSNLSETCSCSLSILTTRYLIISLCEN